MKIFNAPEPEDEYTRGLFHIMRVVIFILLIGLVCLTILNFFLRENDLFKGLIIAYAVVILGWVWVIRGKYQQAIFLIAAGLLVMVTYQATFGQGLHDISMVAYPGLLIVSSLVLNRKGIIAIAALTILAVTWLTLTDIFAWYPRLPVNPADFSDLLIVIVILVVCAAWTVLLSENTRRSLQKATMEISERERIENRLLHAAVYDSLTGLPNRLLLSDRLEQVIRRQHRKQEDCFAVIFMDLDRFKDINDTLGHQVGDLLLTAISRRVEGIVRSSDTFARLSGDEFVILLTDLKEKADIFPVVERLQEQMLQPFQLNDAEVMVSFSIGIVYSTGEYTRPDDVLMDADIAMYRCKAMRHKHADIQYQVFDPSMRSDVLVRLKTQAELRQALEKHEFCLYYQPIFSTQSLKVVGMEVLIRWQHPKEGLILPGRFIPFAEEGDLIIPIDQWVLNEACSQLATWRKRFPIAERLIMNVNVSSKNFSQSSLAEKIIDVLVAHHVPPHQVELEITESMLMENVELAVHNLRELQKHGIRAAIDDFGSGFSSLTYLVRLPIHTLKIDRTFIAQMSNEPQKYEIVKTIISLAHALKLPAVAEGIETQHQLEMIKETACDFVQGFLFSRPLYTEAMTKFLENQVDEEKTNR
ncbi:MAG TPA: EAL domain-containing protein [Anaerolineaceae bacterium]